LEQQQEALNEALNEALAADKLTSEFESARALLAALAPYLPSEQRQQAFIEALTAAEGIRGKAGRAEALVALARDLPRDLQIRAILSLIDITASMSRSETLLKAGATASLVVELGGGEAIDQLFRAINDVCSWYP
jgi:hypothetical protein